MTPTAPPDNLRLVPVRAEAEKPEQSRPKPKVNQSAIFAQYINVPDRIDKSAEVPARITSGDAIYACAMALLPPTYSGLFADNRGRDLPDMERLKRDVEMISGLSRMAHEAAANNMLFEHMLEEHERASRVSDASPPPMFSPGMLSLRSWREWVFGR